uniref:Serum response factor-binding protein 1 n=1 Tax=Periophthalmus magnuspinnatus TaxID=409849 RepID=A0A3B3ZBA6_9GOBI
MQHVLNLNNEVVKMRKEVKRVRALIIRKMTRQIGALRKKKGSDTDIERNQRRAARLLDEIHAMKLLVPDVVTKTALQKNLNFQQVCKDPKSTISARALARVATHPQFNKKIEAIKAAVKAFKEERTKGGKAGGKKEKKADKTQKQSPSANPEKQPDVKVKKTGTATKSETDIGEACHEEPCHNFPEEKIDSIVHQTEAKTAKSDVKQSPVKPVVKSKPLNKQEEPKNTAKLLELPPKPNAEAESELESDGEKEYFDDSTEERFHKKSSGESESDDDFFVGKVSKFKKKKTKTTEDKTVQKILENTSKTPQTDKVQSQFEELESRLTSKANALKSVFCSSLARTKNEHSDGGKGFGKGPKDSRGRGAFSHQAPQKSLHPSWEASKKRKEQQGQILAFQGKKIKFDDDD